MFPSRLFQNLDSDGFGLTNLFLSAALLSLNWSVRPPAVLRALQVGCAWARFFGSVNDRFYGSRRSHGFEGFGRFSFVQNMAAAHIPPEMDIELALGKWKSVRSLSFK